MVKMYLFLFSLIFSFQANASGEFNISGIVRNQMTGESIIGATVEVVSAKEAVTTNEYGFFSISLPSGDYKLSVSSVGMQTKEIDVHLVADFYKVIFLEELSKTLDEVIVRAEQTGRSISGTQMGVERLSIKDMKFIPLLLGERDPLKAIQLLPGIKPASEGSSGIYVRGGTADENLILLDEAPVYNASHLLGFFSTFNSDAIKDVTVYKGGMPAQFGGRLSSVIDIRMNDGNNQQLSVSGGLGLISSKLNIEAPIQKNKSSFLLSGRTTYVDIFLKASGDSTINRNRVGFYDLNAKMNYILGKKDQLFISGYFGSDHLNAGGDFGLRWGNGTGTLRWNHIYNNRIFANTSLIYSNFNYEIDIKLGANNLNIFSQIRDWNLKEELQWNLNSRHKLNLGINAIYHSLHPGDVTSSVTSNFNDIIFQKRYSLENAFFISDTYKASPKLSFTYGARVSAFSILGSGDFYDLNPEGKIVDTIHVPNGKIFKTYFNLEPRISGRLLLSPSASIKAAYARNAQYLHLISNSTSARPTDQWVATTNNIKPETSDQFSIGYYKNIFNNAFELSAETYYKTLQNQIDYRDGSDINDANKIETQLIYGKGRAYGIELLIRKKSGKLNGWISYTLAKSEKRINGINNNDWYNARQDRTHDLAIVVAYQLSKKWTISSNWVYYTGDAVSFPEGKYQVGNQVYYYYTKRNGYRMPPYHRLDFGATKSFKSKGRFSSELTLGIYNAYGRENAYSITFQENKDDISKTEAVQTALFKFIPSISYNFKF